ncbi:hypothetical protein ACOSP7_016745 [Xanthoceras sorbifolium]|uniref:WAT1-related protein n=1 Tax=Xanthoceras sorbifolium TaxID=99658 RepID=A0ABQ8HIE3_9ROSI|nr:hypothetical protein JRO89_XS10G0121800 [Xanthoceras sorbifolium]
MVEMNSCKGWKPFIAMIAIEFAFAIVNILLKEVLEHGMNDLVFITYRLSISAVFLAPFGHFLERKSRPKLTLGILCYLFISAVVGTSVTQFLFLLGIRHTSATFACAFINMVPVITFIMALPFGIEKVNIKCNSGKAKVVGTLVCIAGGILLILYKGVPLFDSSHSEPETQNHSHSTRGTEKWTLGCIALTAGTLFWSSWFVIQSNIGKRYPCQYTSTAIVTFFGAIQSAILSLCTSRKLSIWIPKDKIEIFSILYAGMIGSGLCYVGMAWCVKKKGPVFTAAFSPLVQIMAAMFDIPILHEQLHLGSLLGSITVIAGLYILLWGKDKEMRNCSSRVAQAAEESQKCREQDTKQEPQMQQETQLQVITVSCDPNHPRDQVA